MKDSESKISLAAEDDFNKNGSNIQIASTPGAIEVEKAKIDKAKF